MKENATIPLFAPGEPYSYRDPSDAELSRRSLPSAAALALGCFLIWMFSGAIYEGPAILPELLVFSVVANGLRFALALGFPLWHRLSSRLWRACFQVLGLGNALIWGLGSGYLLVSYPNRVATYFVMMITVAMGAGASTSLAPSLWQLRAYVVLLLLPGALFGCFSGAPDPQTLGWMHLVFLGFLWVHGGQNHHTLWEYWKGRRRLEENAESLRRMSREAHSASEAKTLFLAGMSHEIRTPMNGVLGMAELLLQTPLQPDQRDMVGTLRRSGEHLLELLNDVLDLSRIEAGKIDIRPEVASVTGLTAEAVRMLEPIVRSRGLRLDFEGGLPRDQRHHIDPLRYKQIVANLVSNAVKFTEKGGITLRLLPGENPLNGTSAESRRPGIRLEVEDTGVGIAAENIPRIFQAFTQVDASSTRLRGGSGLGLTITRHWVEVMGGRISVESKIGQGSTFRVDLPLSEATPEEWAQAQQDEAKKKEAALSQTAEKPNASPEAALPESLTSTTRRKRRPEETDILPKPTPEFRTARILVAEDHPINRKVVTAMLERLGFAPVLVGDGQEVLASLDREAFDLVLMDCQMPHLDGYEATRRLRAMPSRNQNVPVIALTANAMKGDDIRCLEAGMNDFLPKPVQLAALSAMLEKWLGGM